MQISYVTFMESLQNLPAWGSLSLASLLGQFMIEPDLNHVSAEVYWIPIFQATSLKLYKIDRLKVPTHVIVR